MASTVWKGHITFGLISIPVRQIPEFRRDAGVSASAEEIALARKLVEGLAVDFDPAKYHDNYQGRLQQMIEAKRAGQTIITTPAVPRAAVGDILQTLRDSLRDLPKRKPAPMLRAAASIPLDLSLPTGRCGPDSLLSNSCHFALYHSQGHCRFRCAVVLLENALTSQIVNC